MLWAGIEYSDGSRINHIFRRCLVYTVAGKLHVSGTAICGVVFSHDTSGSRVDVMSGMIVGVDRRPSPMHACENCERALAIEHQRFN